jgi:hypothetical protein
MAISRLVIPFSLLGINGWTPLFKYFSVSPTYDNADIQQGEKAEVVFTFTTPLPYQLGTTVQGQIIDTQGNTYPITFTVVENVEKINC